MAIELYTHGCSEQLIPPPPDTFRCGNIYLDSKTMDANYLNVQDQYYTNKC